MHWYIASTAEDNQVFVLVVAVVADRALCILLHDESPLVRTERVVSLDVEAVQAVSVTGTLLQLL